MSRALSRIPTCVGSRGYPSRHLRGSPRPGSPPTMWAATTERGKDSPRSAPLTNSSDWGWRPDRSHRRRGRARLHRRVGGPRSRRRDRDPSAPDPMGVRRPAIVAGLPDHRRGQSRLDPRRAALRLPTRGSDAFHSHQTGAEDRRRPLVAVAHRSRATMCELARANKPRTISAAALLDSSTLGRGGLALLSNTCLEGTACRTEGS